MFISYFQCLSAELDLDATQIENLADDINNAIADVVNVDEILAATSGDLTAAMNLKHRAEIVRADAQAQLAGAEGVTKALSDAEESQDAADLAITNTRTDIDAARKDLAQVSIKTSIGVVKIFVYDYFIFVTD